MDRCRVKQHRDGTLLVKAKHLEGTPLWGAALGQESNAFDNEVSCVSEGKARNCTLAALGMEARTTAPDSCTIFLADNGPTLCAAYVKKCIPQPPPLPCTLLPADNIWNADISSLPVHSSSATWVNSIGASSPVHPDFGPGLYAGGMIGIPYTVVPSRQPLVPVSFLYDDESDPGPYPIPPFAPVEGGSRPGRGRGDAHVLVVESDTCTLYEVFSSRSKAKGTRWTAGSGAVFDLNSNALRPDTWTSADAAGLPILPGLVRYDEIEAGIITHAIRFTAAQTQRAYVWPARHFASSSTNPALPPMGIRARLKASVDISGFSATNQVILTALKTYGMFLADNGSPWFISGVPDSRWDNDDLRDLRTLQGSDFEIVDESSLMVDPDSGQAASP